MPTQPETPEPMTYEEAASRLSVSVNWLRQAVRDKTIPHTKLSDRVIRFTEDDLRAILAQSRVEPVEAPPKKSSTPAPSRRKRAS